MKGGQALRIKENLRSRFSADMDFSVPNKISEDSLFFDNVYEVLKAEFWNIDIHLFDFTPVRKPKIRKEGTPDFWGGWEVSFKLISKDQITLPIEKQQKQAIVPTGTQSPKIKFDISEYEYCASVEKVKVKSVEVNVYSRALLLLEKIRALCQQHPDYTLTGSDSRARDYFDIERLWNKVIVENNEPKFLDECRKHLAGVFGAKKVDLKLLSKLFDSDFIELQKTGWPSVVSTVSMKLQAFEYYNEVLKDIVQKITHP